MKRFMLIVAAMVLAAVLPYRAFAQTGSANVLPGVFTSAACTSISNPPAPNAPNVYDGELCFSLVDNVLRQWNGTVWNAIAGPAGAFGTGTLVAGTVTVSNAAIAATAVCDVSEDAATPVSYLSYTVAAGSITIKSGSSTDTSKVSYSCRTP